MRPSTLPVFHTRTVVVVFSPLTVASGSVIISPGIHGRDSPSS